MPEIFLCFAIISFLTGVASFLHSLANVRRFTDEAEAEIVKIEHFGDNKIDYRNDSDKYPTGYVYVKYKYKGLILKSRVKSSAQFDSTIKIRINPKKPNQCCLPRPYFKNLIICTIVSVFMLYCYFRFRY